MPCEKLSTSSPCHRPSSNSDLAAVRAESARYDTYERRFARAVLAEKAVDASGGEVERHHGEGVARAVALVETAQREARRARRDAHSAAYGTVSVRARTASASVSTSCRTSAGMSEARAGL